MVVRYALLAGVLILSFVMLAALLPSLLFAVLALSGAVLGIAVIARQRRTPRRAGPHANVRWVAPATLWRPLHENHQACYPPISRTPLRPRTRASAPLDPQAQRLTSEIAGTVRAIAALDVIVELSDDGGGQAERFIDLWGRLATVSQYTDFDRATSRALALLATGVVTTDATADVFADPASGAGQAFISLFGRLERLVAGAADPAQPPPVLSASVPPGTQRTHPGGPTNA